MNKIDIEVLGHNTHREMLHMRTEAASRIESNP